MQQVYLQLVPLPVLLVLLVQTEQEELLVLPVIVKHLDQAVHLAHKVQQET